MELLESVIDTVKQGLMGRNLADRSPIETARCESYSDTFPCRFGSSLVGCFTHLACDLTPGESEPLAALRSPWTATLLPASSHTCDWESPTVTPNCESKARLIDEGHRAHTERRLAQTNSWRGRRSALAHMYGLGPRSYNRLSRQREV